MSAPPFVFDVQAATFQDEVVLRSRQTPVLLDFWADWCGPCKTLGPILEKIADEYGGSFLLGKVDTEAERELGAAFQVQSIPFCILIADGRPVDGFTGALPDPEVRKFLAAAGIEPGAPAPATAEDEASDPDSAAARLAAGRAAAKAGDPATARERLEGILEEEDEHEAAGKILGGLGLFEVPVAAGDGEAATALLRARETFLAGDATAAAEALLESVAADKGYADGLARRALVLCLEYFGDEETANEYRRRVATLLY